MLQLLTSYGQVATCLLHYHLVLPPSPLPPINRARSLSLSLSCASTALSLSLPLECVRRSSSFQHSAAIFAEERPQSSARLALKIRTHFPLTGSVRSLSDRLAPSRSLTHPGLAPRQNGRQQVFAHSETCSLFFLLRFHFAFVAAAVRTKNRRPVSIYISMCYIQYTPHISFDLAYISHLINIKFYLRFSLADYFDYYFPCFVAHNSQAIKMCKGDEKREGH